MWWGSMRYANSYLVKTCHIVGKTVVLAASTYRLQAKPAQSMTAHLYIPLLLLVDVTMCNCMQLSLTAAVATLHVTLATCAL